MSNIRNIKFNKIQSITANATFQLMIEGVAGNRHVLQMQNQGTDAIAYCFDADDAAADENFFTLNPNEWLFFEDYILQNDIFVKSTGADAKVVFIVNQSKV